MINKERDEKERKATSQIPNPQYVLEEASGDASQGRFRRATFWLATQKRPKERRTSKNVKRNRKKEVSAMLKVALHDLKIKII